MKRRKFIQALTLAGVSAILADKSLHAAAFARAESQKAFKSKAGFTAWQLPSQLNTIGNSYVFLSRSGKIVVMDGGKKGEAPFLRGFLSALGGKVDAWFISHPHTDHIGALTEILKDPSGLEISHIYHSRLSDEMIEMDTIDRDNCKEAYALLDSSHIPVTDIRQTGGEYDFGGMKLKVLGVANDEIHNNAYNNSSMILRVWDRKKSIVFLGDAGIECGDKVLNGPYRHLLDCDYLQMAHHGQRGCSEQFYKSIKFRVCLWPTPLWVWNNDRSGKGINTGTLETFETRRWMDEIGITEHHVSCLEGVWRLD